MGREKKQKRDSDGGKLLGIRLEIRMERGEGGRRVRLGEEWWRFIRVYVNRDLEMKLEELREWVEEREKGERVLVGEDFNARTGR